jgi:hypothetical protein
MSLVDQKPPQIYRSKCMSRTLYARSDPRGSSQAAARRAKFDVITAAMLTGGASGGWGMARALKSFAARRGDALPCREQATGARRKLRCDATGR